MIRTGRYDIQADRWVACIRTFTFVGYDFTDGVFVAQVRQKPDLTGTPEVDLATVVSAAAEGLMLEYAGTDTIANHITAGRLASVPDAINPATGVPYVASDSVDLSILRMRINETTMEGMPPAAELGDNAELYWDLHITPDGGIKDKWLGGEFVVVSGVTQ